jgi:hypothetical protein
MMHGPINIKLTVLVLYGHETWYPKEHYETGCWGDDVYLRQRNLDEAGEIYRMGICTIRNLHLTVYSFSKAQASS